MKEIRIKIYGWSDLKKWFWDTLCFPRRKLVAEWLGFYNNQMRMYTEEFLLKYNNKDFVKNNYAILNKALEDWNKEAKKIYDETMEMIMINRGRVMAQVKMYSKKDKRFVNFPIACTPSGDECKKCKLKFNCDKAQIKEEE